MKLYYFLKTLFAGLYIATWLLSLKLFLLPLITLYGGWTFLGYFIGIFLAAAIFSGIWFWLPKPRQPQATYRDDISSLVIPLAVAVFKESERDTFPCYQCGEEVNYLFDDARCKDCTRLTQDEIEGNIS